MDNNLDRNIELRSEKVRNVIGQIPPVLLRYGTMIICIALVVMILLAAVIPYEEVLPIEVKIETVQSQGKMIGEAYISGYDIDKVAMGQKVIILAPKYGNIVGSVSHISSSLLVGDSVRIWINMDSSISMPRGSKFAGRLVISRIPILKRFLGI